MSTFDAEFQGTPWTDLIAMFGVTATHTPAGGSAASVTGLWEPNAMLPGYYAESVHDVATGVFTFLPSDIPSWGLKSRFTINGLLYAVKDVGDRTPLVNVQLEARREVEVVSEGHRMRR